MSTTVAEERDETMARDQSPLQPAADAGAGTESVETRTLNSYQRKALARGRMTVLTYLKLVPIFALAGEALFWFVGLFERATIPDRGQIIFAPIYAVALLTFYFLVLDAKVGLTRLRGKYTCFAGPMKIDTEARPQPDGSTSTVYRLVLGSFMSLYVTSKDASQMQPRMTQVGQADLAGRGHRLLELRNDVGVTIFLDDQLREALGTGAPDIP
jgi:hypothetical protein